MILRLCIYAPKIAKSMLDCAENNSSENFRIQSVFSTIEIL